MPLVLDCKQVADSSLMFPLGDFDTGFEFLNHFAKMKNKTRDPFGVFN